MPGMGDNCCLPTSMGMIKKTIEDNTPEGTLVHSLMIGGNALDDTVNGFLKPVNDQVAEVCDFLASDPAFADGYNAIGFSQVCDACIQSYSEIEELGWPFRKWTFALSIPF